jgi:hypothetical protein
MIGVWRMLSMGFICCSRIESVACPFGFNDFFLC